MTGRGPRARIIKVPPPLDVHAHVAPDISTAAVRQLGAHVFAMTRSLDEHDAVRDRNDPRLIWGVGVHPGVARAVDGFTQPRFAAAIEHTPLVGEVGLDASSRVPMRQQLDTLRSIFEVLQDHPRLISVHTSGAHLHLIRELHRTPVDGVILHWWTGSPELTDEAVRLGCVFSFPPAMPVNSAALARIPADRLLPETDHPDGDRTGTPPRRPGRVGDVETATAQRLDEPTTEIRRLFWNNLRRLTDRLALTAQFPADWRPYLSN